MTLRLTEEQDAVLTALAKRQGISKNEAALRAILKAGDDEQQDDEVRRITREAIDRYGPLLDRLAQ